MQQPGMSSSDPDYVEKQERQQEITDSRYSMETDNSGTKEIVKPAGVRKIEVVAKQYKLPGMIMIYFFVFLFAYAYSLDGTLRGVFQPIATSSYSNHSLLATINVVKGVVAAITQPVVARLADVFGRIGLLFGLVLFYVVGTVIESQAYDVQRFAAGVIFYQIGYTGIVMVIMLLTSDFSFLNWRLVCLLVPGLPFLINTWISGNITSDLGDQWSWGIGMWAIIVPVVALPLLIALSHMMYRAHKDPEWRQFDNEKTGLKRAGFKKWCVFLFWKLDVVGIILMAAVLALILVPLTLAGGVSTQWKQAKIIAPLVLGFCCIPLFILWERWCPYPVTPFQLLKNRAIWSAMIIAVMINFISSLQADYLYTVLIVAVNESQNSATRITSLFAFVSTIVGTLLGLVVTRLRRLKMFSIFGTCMWMVSMGLMVKFRGGSDSKAGIIGAQCLMGFGAGFFTYPVQTQLQASVKHEHMGIVTALYLTLYNVGLGLGSAVSGAIWTQLLPTKLGQVLKDDELAMSAYGDPFNFIKTYTWDTPERQAVVGAYQSVQRVLLITATCLCVPLILATFFTRDLRLESVQSLEDAEKTDDQYEERLTWKEKYLPKFK